MLSKPELERRKKEHERRQRGAIHIATLSSFTTKGQTYDILIGSDNLVYCTCPSWLYCEEEIQTCKHLKLFKETLREEITRRQSESRSAAVTKPATTGRRRTSAKKSR